MISNNMRTLFESYLISETPEMFCELAGHAYNLKAICSDPNGDEYVESYMAIVSKNTKPDELPWRMTVATSTPSLRGKASVVHVQLESEYSYLDTNDGMWQRDIIGVVQEYINPDCIALEPTAITRKEQDVITHVSH